MRFLLPLILVLATCWADPNPLFDNVPPQPFEEEEDDYRLPKNIVPTNYLIDLEVFLDTEGEKDFYYNGHSKISLSLTGNSEDTTKDITFHAKDLEIVKEKSFVTYQNDSMPASIGINDINIVEYKDFVTLTLNENINGLMKNLVLDLYYTGKLTDDTAGFYRRSYVDENGKQRWLAATHFEPTGARKAFPCWDEPDIKTPFVISITAPKNYTAISNMVIAQQSEKGKTTFMETLNIPTYLVAFVIADYNRTQTTDGSYGIWTKPQDKESADFAFQFGQQVLQKMADFTGIKYYDLKTGTKMDQIAIPDFGPGAMENYGLVMYRESGLLYTEGKTLTEDKQDIGTVIAHEFAHQWFGNLVTCKWWNDIWLNEGFASFFQYYITNQVVPESEKWEIMDQFVVKNLHPVFVTDAAVETRPLDPTIVAQTPKQISSLFDDIAYKKGASILRMMQQFLGEDVFKSGLRNYLKTYQYKSVTSDDLFTAIQNAAPKEVKNALPENKSLMEVMKNWVKEAGYPVVIVKESSDIVNITQERFFVDTSNHDETQWYIPITYITEDASKNKTQIWMNPNENLIIKHNKDQWMIINVDQKGYYRVNYDDPNWKLLSKYLTGKSYKTIPTTNRAQLIDDAFALARVGRTNYTNALDITKYLSQETDYIPWVSAVKTFDYLDNVLRSSEQYQSYKTYVTQRIETFAKTVNYTQPTASDKHTQRLSQVLALNTACKYGLKSCQDFASKKLNEWLEPKTPEKKAREEEEKEKLPIDYRNGIFCAGLRNADQGTWNKTVEKYKSSKDQDEKNGILAGLGCAPSTIADVFLASALDSKAKFPINVFEAMNSIYKGNGDSLNSLLIFINDNLEKIKEADDNNSNLKVILNKLSTRVTTPNQFVELSLLVHGKLHMYNDFEVKYAIDNLAWIQFHLKVVENWIQNEVKEEKNLNNSTSSVTVISLSLLIASVLFARFY